MKKENSEGGSVLPIPTQDSQRKIPWLQGKRHDWSPSWMAEQFQAEASLTWHVAPKGSMPKIKWSKDHRGHAYINSPVNPSVAEWACLRYTLLSTSHSQEISSLRLLSKGWTFFSESFNINFHWIFIQPHSINIYWAPPICQIVF